MSKFLDKTGLDTFWAKIKSTFQTQGNLVTSWGSTPSDTKYPSEKLVKDSLDSSVLYANQKWGGAFRKTLSPIDVFGMMGHNVFLGAFASCIKVEYSTDGGTTWLDYGLTDTQKMALFSQFNNSAIAYCGKNTHIQPGYTGTIAGTKDLTNDIIANQRLRITISSRPFANEGTTSATGTFAIITRIRRLGILMSTQSAGAGTHCVISTRSTANFEAGNDVWATHGDFDIVGDSGWNSIPCDNGTAENGFTFGGHGTGGAAQYNEIRFEIWSTQLNANPVSSQTGNLAIYAICGLADKINSTNSKFHAFARYGYNCTSVDLANGYPVFGNGIKFMARKLKTNLARTADSTFDGSADQTNIPVTGTLLVANGGTGKASVTANSYLKGNGTGALVERTYAQVRTDLGLGSVYSKDVPTSGNASTSQVVMGNDTRLTDSRTPTSHASSATTYGVGTTSNYGHVKLATGDMNGASDADGVACSKNHTHSQYLTSHQDISGKMNTSASNATAPSSSGGDGATATLLNNLTDGNSDIVTTDDGDNVLIATTDNGGTVTNKWYKRKLVKLIPWIIKKLGTRLVYDCGAGSTSGDDFDAALAAFNAGQWVIIRKDGIAYYCVGSYSGPGLRFKQIANDGSLLKVNTISWTRGSSPSVVTQIEASLSGHTHSQYLTASDITGKMATDCSNKASGALQNLTSQLTEGTSAFTDGTEIFSSYASDSGFSSTDHVNQPYRRKASSMLKYIANSGLAQLVQIYGNSAKKLEIGYATIADSGNSSEMKALVELTCVSQSSTSQPGSSILMLVSVSCSNTYRFAKATILENTFWDGRTRPVIVTKVVSNRMYVYVGLLANNGTSLVSFDYTYAKITRIGHVNNWSWEHEYTSDGTFDHIFYCDDSVKFVPTVNSNTIGTTAGISNNSPADACVTYWSAMQPGCIRIVYNQNGTEYTLLFSKSSDGKYGSILKWSYTDNYMRIIRIQNNSVLTGADWVKISAGYADSAGSLSSSVSVGSANQPVYFNNGVPTACNWWVS